MAEMSQERIDELDESIAGARQAAEQDGLLSEDNEPTLIDPDGDGDADPEGMEIAPG